MRIVIIGYGVQGQKRYVKSGYTFTARVDPFHSDAEFKYIEDIALESYDAAIVCTPDEKKIEIIKYLVQHGKHILIEKPLFFTQKEYEYLSKKCHQSGIVLQTAYNHRFEPHFIRFKKSLEKSEIGTPYHLRMVYGNGTSLDVKRSSWRDKGSGVWKDLGSHLLDTISFWFGKVPQDLNFSFVNHFENSAPDHVLAYGRLGSLTFDLEVTLLSWKNQFKADLILSHGSLHIDGLCKWGPSVFTSRQRIYPSGKPNETSITIEESDNTWQKELQSFIENCKQGNITTLSNDLSIQQALSCLAPVIKTVDKADISVN